MSEPNIPPGKLVAIDLSKSQFRGSGALYQSDRLTIGRSKFQPIEGPTQVIEKVVYKESPESQSQLQELQTKLQEALYRYVMVAIDHKRISKELEDSRLRAADKSDKVFESNLAFELQRLKTEVSRLNQLLADKEREIVTVRDSEIRKSMIQTGEMSIRLMALKKENERLQEANLEKIHQINQGNAAIHKIREEHARNLAQVSNDPRVHELERIIGSKEQEIKHLVQRGQEAERLQKECDTLRIELNTIQTASRSELSAYESEILRLKRMIDESTQRNSDHSDTLKKQFDELKEECNSLRSALDAARASERQTQSQLKDTQLKSHHESECSRRELTTLEEQLAAVSGALGDLQSEKATLTSKLVGAESTVKTLEAGLKSMLFEKEQAQRTFAEVQTGFRQLQRERVRDREEIEELKSKISGLQEQTKIGAAETGGKLSNLATQKAGLERELVSLKECLEVSQKCIKSLEAQLNEKALVEMKLAEVIQTEARQNVEREREREREIAALKSDIAQAAELSKAHFKQEHEQKHQTMLESLKAQHEVEKDNLRADIKSLSNEIITKEQLIEQLNQKLTHSQTELKNLEHVFEKLQIVESQNEELHKKIAQGSNLQQALMEQLEKAKDSIDQYSERSAALDELRQTNALLERELRDKGSKLIQIHKTLDEFQESIQRDQEAHSASLAKMKAQRDQLEKELEKANAEIERTNTEIVSKLQSELITLVTAMETAQSQISAYKQQQNELLAQNEQLNQDLTDAAERIESLAQEAATFRQRTAFLEAELSAIASSGGGNELKSNPLEPMLNLVEHKLQESEARELQAQQRLQMLEEELQGLQVVSNTLKEELIQEAKDKLSIQAQLGEQTARIEQLQRELAELHSSSKALQEEHEDLESELRLKEAKLNRAEVELSDRNKRILSLERELEQGFSHTATDLAAQHARLSEAEAAVRQLTTRVTAKDEIIADLEQKGQLLAAEVRRLSEERQQTSNILQQTIGDLTKSRTREQELRAAQDKTAEELGEARSQLSSLKFKLLDIESKSSVQTIGYEEMLKDKVGELETRDEMIMQLQGDLDSLISRMKEDKRGWKSARGDDLEAYIHENKRLAEELKQARLVEEDLRQALEVQEKEIEKLLDRLDVFEADLTVNIKNAGSSLSPTSSKQDTDLLHGSAVKPSPSQKSMKNTRSALQHKPKINLEPFREHFGSSKKYNPQHKSKPILMSTQSPKQKELQTHLNHISNLRSLTAESSDQQEAVSDDREEEIKIEIPFSSFGFKDQIASKPVLQNSSSVPKSRKFGQPQAKLLHSHSSSSSKNSRAGTSSSKSSTGSKRGASYMTSSRISRQESDSFKQGSYLQSVQESAGLGNSPKYYEHHHQPISQLVNSRQTRELSHSGSKQAKQTAETELYKAEAEKFRLMYNDAQRSLLQMRDEGLLVDEQDSYSTQQPRPERRVTVPLGELLGKGPSTQMFRVDGVDLEVKIHEKSTPGRQKDK